MDQPSTCFPLLDLPSELRQEIYRYAVTYESPIHFRLDRTSVLEPALLATNRQIRNEAMSLFYGQNTFYATLNGIVEEALLRLSEDKLTLFKSIQAFSTWRLQKFTPDRWLRFVRRQMPILLEECGRGFIKEEVFLVPLKGRTGIIWATADSLDEYEIVSGSGAEGQYFQRKELDSSAALRSK